MVYLDGTIYTAREGVYARVIEDGFDLPLELPASSATNFHCSPAATQHEDGSFALGAVTATASFRFSKWIGPWMKASGAKIIIGKGGMSPDDYRNHFVPNGAIYLTTVGYGDIAPQTPIGQTISALVMVLGYGIIAVPTGLVTAELVKPRNSQTPCPHCGHNEHYSYAQFCCYCGQKLS